MYRLRSRIGVAAAAALVALAVAGCATHRAARQGNAAVKTQNWDAAVYYYLEALAREPSNVEYRMQLARARQKAAQEHFTRGEALKKVGRLLSARNELQMAVQLDPTHQFAEQELRKVTADLDVLSRPHGKETLEELKRKAAEAKVKPPLLNPRSDEPITLSFPKPKPVKEIYRAMAKAYGFNVLFDPKLKDDKLSIELKDVTSKRALEIVMQAAGHFYKVLDEHSVIIADDTPQNRRDYEDLVIKTFFLSNAEVKDVDKMLRSLIEARRLATNEQLNAITLRDTADKVAIAEKLININDKAKAEVMIDVELMEVNSNKLQELGTKLSTYSFALNLNSSNLDENGQMRLDDLNTITRGDWSVTVPNVLINLVKSTTEATSLAQPQMRITEGEKGKLHIGSREPIPVTSFNSSNTIGSNIVPITSFQYQDVGIKIEVEPRVHHNREITLKVTVEVSNIAGSRDGQPIIGTRTINTVIRLKDGETNMLVGLYKEDKSSEKTKIPLLSDIPLLGRLFTNDSKTLKTNDLVLTLTPHIIRYPDIEEKDLAPLWVGTEKRISFSGNSPRIRSGTVSRGPFDRGSTRRDTKSRSRRPATSRRGVRAQPTSRNRPGVSLVPPSGLKKESAPARFEPDDTAAAEGDAGAAEAQVEPLLLRLDPAVVSLQPGEATAVQLILDRGSGTFRLSAGLSYDPHRVQVDAVELAPGMIEVGRTWDREAGWISLELITPELAGAPVAVAAVRVHAVAPGAAPLSLSSDGAVAGNGAAATVGVSDGAVYVLGEAPAGGGD